MTGFFKKYWVIPIMLVISTGVFAQSPPSNMVRLNGGTFLMGSPLTEPERQADEIQHQVTVDSFSIGRYQVTQREYEDVMGTNPSYFKGPNLPVEMVSWYDAIEYCNRRSQREGLTPVYTIDKSQKDPMNGNDHDTLKWLVTLNLNANGYRLPTEAEWEYACRAGTITAFSFGRNASTDDANYDGHYPYDHNLPGEYRQMTTEGGNFEPNPWGLYDMHGNVWEWCWDWYDSYNNNAQTNPHGPLSGDNRVERGGAWHNQALHLRSAYRGNATPSIAGRDIGFRVVRP